MASPVVSAMSDITTLWEAASPPDNTEVTYHEVESHEALDGASGDRAFYFEDPERLEPFGQSGADITQVDWLLRPVLRLSRYGRSMISMRGAIANESNLLARQIEANGSWTAGILSVITEGTEIERDEESGDAMIFFNIRVGCTETD